MNPKEPWEWWTIGGLTLVVLAAVGVLVHSYLRPAWEISAEVAIARPAEEVFDVLLDPERRTAWQPGVMGGGMLTGEQGEAGATWLLILRRGRERGEAEERLLARDRPGRIEFLREATRSRHHVEIELTALPGGTRLVWRERIAWKDRKDRLLAIFRIGEEEDRLRTALARLARIMEEG